MQETAGRVLVTGASGYIGSRLAPALLEAGRQITVLARHPEAIRERRWAQDESAVRIVAGDATDPDDLAQAMDGVDVAYYLLHSMDGKGGFEERDKRMAHGFARAAVDAGVSRIVYQSGLYPEGERLSDHLASRKEVGEIFLACEVPATVLQAAVIIGSGSASFEMLRHLTHRLPAMIAPRWLGSRIEPIAIRDVIRLLVAAADVRGDSNRTFDIGCGEVLTYRDLIDRFPRRWPAPQADRAHAGPHSAARQPLGRAGDAGADRRGQAAGRKPGARRRLRGARHLGGGGRIRSHDARRGDHGRTRRARAWSRRPAGARRGGSCLADQCRPGVGGLSVTVSQPRRQTAAAAVTLAVGTPMLRRAIRSPRGGMAFRRSTVELAAVWTAGATVTRALGVRVPARLFGLRAVVLRSAATGVATVGVFTVGALVGARLPFVRDRMADVLDHARKGPLPTVTALALLTGAAEEVFFRGALYDVAGKLGLPAVQTTTAVHMAVTAATGNPMLVLASGPLSALAGLERARTGSVVAPVVLHVVWSTGMLLVLPPIVERRTSRVE